jgi:hypothetical protein
MEDAIVERCLQLWLVSLHFVIISAKCDAAGNVDLGTACGRLFRVGVLAITDPGDSDIIAKTTGES